MNIFIGYRLILIYMNIQLFNVRRRSTTHLCLGALNVSNIVPGGESGTYGIVAEINIYMYILICRNLRKYAIVTHYWSGPAFKGLYPPIKRA